jgi:hypothetical protein
MAVLEDDYKANPGLEEKHPTQDCSRIGCSGAIKGAQPHGAMRLLGLAARAGILVLATA